MTKTNGEWRECILAICSFATFFRWPHIFLILNLLWMPHRVTEDALTQPQNNDYLYTSFFYEAEWASAPTGYNIFFKGEYIKVMEQWHYKHTPALFKEHPKRKAKYNKLQPILQGASHCQSSGPPSLRAYPTFISWRLAKH
jgi:hypothetical protein